jgi:hypothetical protein
MFNDCLLRTYWASNNRTVLLANQASISIQGHHAVDDVLADAMLAQVALLFRC